MTLFRTTVFRLSLGFAIFFALVTIGALHYVSHVTVRNIEDRAQSDLYAELEELKDHYQASGLDYLVNVVAFRDYYGHFLRHYYALLRKGEPYVAGSHFLARGMGPAEFTSGEVSYFPITEYITDNNKTVILRVAQLPLDDGWYLRAAVAQDFVTQLRAHTSIVLVYAVPIIILLAVATGAYMGRSVMSRIWRMDQGLQESIAANFRKSLLVPAQNDEFQALTLKLNLALARVAELLQGMRAVSDNVAHDLRGPLNRIRSHLEVALLRERSCEEYRHVIVKAIEDSDALLNTFNALLTIAQAECGASREKLEAIDLSQLADEMAELYAAVAEEKNLQFIWTKPACICVQCGRQVLAQAISNLLENAIKYTPAGGTVAVSVEKLSHYVALTIRDTGPGIAEKDRKRVLERFERLDSARSQPGNGLGLSLVNAVAKLCRAELVLGDNNPGLAIELRFPLTP